MVAIAAGMQRLLFVFAAVSLFGGSGCSSDLTDGGNGGDGNGGGSSLGGGSSVSNDLPCDIATILSDHCVSCHSGSNPAASVPLTSYAELMATSPAYPTQTVATRALARMMDATFPMPPAGAIPADQIAAFQAWITAGTPKGDCGSAGGGGGDPTAVQCTSNQYWHGEEGRDMDPGQACIACHEKGGGGGEEDEGGPPLGFAGTVYPTLHEPDDCLATTGLEGVTVFVTDANGNTFEEPVRTSSGNFMALETYVAMPITAEVRKNGKAIKMMAPVDSGDCNACHTVQGTDGAAGRIIAPE